MSMIGGIISLIAILELRFIPRWHEQWWMPKVKTVNIKKDSDQFTKINHASSALLGRFFLLGTTTIVFLLIITSIPLFEMIPNILSTQMLKPEYNSVILDFVVRTFIYKILYLMPIFISGACLLILLPRLNDLDLIIQKKLKLTGPKQYLMGKAISGKLISSVFSKKFVTLILLIGSPIIISRYLFPFFSIAFSIIYLVGITALISVYIGLRLAWSLKETFEKLSVKKYALRHFEKSFIISGIVYAAPLVILLYFMVSFISSNFFTTQLYNLFTPVQLLQPFSLLTVEPISSNLPSAAIGSLIIACIIIVVSMIAISSIYVSGPKRVISGVLFFGSTELLGIFIQSSITGDWGGLLNPYLLMLSFSIAIFVDVLKSKQKVIESKLSKK